MAYKSKREERKKETLETIRTVVDRLVEEKGFEDMTMREICAESGIGLSTFYNYFSSKDDLLFDRYHRLNTMVAQLSEEELAWLSPSDALKRLMSYMIENIRTRVFDMLLNYHQKELRHVQEWYRKEPYCLFQVIDDIVKRGIEDGEFRPDLDREWVRGYLWFLINGCTTMQCMTEEEFLKDSRMEREVERWIDSLRVS